MRRDVTSARPSREIGHERPGVVQWPPDPPQPDAAAGELRLLCDEMLKGVGRWLRAAGYDVTIADDGAHDDELLARARAEGRLLMTCDRRLAARAGNGSTLITVLASERLDYVAPELRERLGIDWLRAPFSRCLVDNARLVPARAQEIARLPVTARRGDGLITRCPGCARLYWPGSHVRRMRARLARWCNSNTAPHS